MLVGLDLTLMDDYLLSFLDQNYEALTTDKVYFIHVEEDLSHNQDLKNKLTKKIESSISKANFAYDLHLVSGDTEKEIRKWSKSQKIDLVLLGHKQKEDPNVEVKKLVKKPGSSLLLIPQKSNYKIQKICVAIDYSLHAHNAIKEAEIIAAGTGAELIGFHAYQVPTGYHYTGKDHLEFAKVMEEHARKDADEFLKKVNLSHIKMAFIYDENKDPADCIAGFTQENSIDMLVMGSKGRTSAASLLIGSVSKKVTQKVHDIPLVIIKEKNEKMDIIDALKEV